MPRPTAVSLLAALSIFVPDAAAAPGAELISGCHAYSTAEHIRHFRIQDCHLMSDNQLSALLGILGVESGGSGGGIDPNAPGCSASAADFIKQKVREAVAADKEFTFYALAFRGYTLDGQHTPKAGPHHEILVWACGANVSSGQKRSDEEMARTLAHESWHHAGNDHVVIRTGPGNDDVTDCGDFCPGFEDCLPGGTKPEEVPCSEKRRICGW